MCVMRSVCDRMSKEMFPAVRALVARELVDVYGFSQRDAAFRMGLTQPAISQYRNNLRGSKVRLLKGNLKVFSLIQEAAASLAKSRKRDNREMIERDLCRICKEIRGQNIA